MGDSVEIDDPDYVSDAVVDVFARKTAALRGAGRIDDTIPGELLLPTIAGVALATGNRVLDFGGALGFHHMVAAQAFPDKDFRWAIVETKAMMARAQTMSTDRLRFFREPEDAADWLGGVDLLHSNGALQFLVEPEATVARLLKLRPGAIAWGRVLLGPAGSTATQHFRLCDHGPGYLDGIDDRAISHRVTTMSRNHFLQAHREYGLILGGVETFFFRRV